MISLLLLVPIFLITFVLYHFYFKRLRLPPGPIPLPFVGNSPQFVGKNCYSAFQKWAEDYGPVYTVWLGELPVVMVTDYELMKKAFNKEEYTGRNFLNNHFILLQGEVNGIIRTEGEQWKQLKKFTLKAMRDYGLEKGVTEGQVLEAIYTLINEVEGEVREGMREHSVDRKVDAMTGSVINRMMFGYSFYGDHYGDFEFLKKMLDIQQQYFMSLSSIMVEARPWLRHFPYISKTYNEGVKALMEIFAFVEKEIEKRLEARKDGKKEENGGGGRGGATSSGDILDQFIDLVEQTDQSDPNNFYKLKYLSTLCFDLFLAGQETTSNTINFLILFLMLDQSAQEKLQAELDAVAAEKRNGGESVVKFGMSDRVRIPYTGAVVNETLRLCNLLPLNLTKVVRQDVEIGGHKLPKGTTVINQIATVLYDEKIFPTPDKFLPERFLDQNGHLKNIEQLVPFGVGKRICPGETLGRMELLLFTANFFYKFHIYAPDPLNPPKYEKRHTFAVKLPEYKCHVEIRRNDDD